MEIKENISLKNLNTFGIEAIASKFVAIRNEDDVKFLAESGSLDFESFLILGKGSNILFVNDYKGLILHSQLKGIKILESNDEFVLLEVAAGEQWHDFVTISLKNKYFGAENLALIPGTVGAAAVQNIGAYGVEQKDFFHSVRGFNLEKNKFEELNLEDCKFSYRDSVFKKELRNKFFVTSVRYKLSKKLEPNLSYFELRQEAEKFNIENTDAQFVYDTVCRLRQSKLPNPNIYGNAGSFFKNPVLTQSIYNKLKEQYPGLKGYKQGEGLIKISAAWLIEKAGWKGKRIGDAGVYDKHSLILINYGNASGQDIFNLSEEIRLSVIDLFGINLEREVQVIQST